MKKVWFASLLAVFFSLLSVSLVSAVPDPRDSVILESKTLAPGSGSPATLIRVWITNKDTIAAVSLPIVERSISGGAYMSLAWPRTFDGTVNSLTPTMRFDRLLASNRYDGVPPDTFTVAGFRDPFNIAETVEYPNASRKALWEIRFDTVFAQAGVVELDSAKVLGVSVGFVTLRDPRDVPAHFVKGIVSVLESLRGDMNGDGGITLADIVLQMNCVFTGEGDGMRADVSCDGVADPTDVILLMNKTFLGREMPCQ